MKFHEFLEKVPNFWTTVAGYPATVQSQINEWFYYRTCCTNDVNKFTRFLSRKLNIVQPQFQNLWEKEAQLNFEPGTLEKVEQTINFVKDEGVVEAIKEILDSTIKDTGTTKNATAITGTDTNKEERNLTTTGKNTGTESRATTNTQTNDTTAATTNSGTETRTISATRTDNLTQTANGDNTESGTVKNDETSSNNNDRRFSDYPQSSPNLDFQNYLTNQEQIAGHASRNNTETRDLTSASNNSITNTGTVENTESNTLTLDTSQSTKNTGTISNDGSDTLTLDTTRTDTQTGNVTDTLTRNTNSDTTLTLDTTQANNSSKDTNRTNDVNTKADTVINTLRTGNLEEAFEKYFRMATTFNSVSWLIGQLDEVFIQIYDYEEESICSSNGNGGGASSEEINELRLQIAALSREVTATMDYAESIHDDLQNTITTVSKNSDDIKTVAQVASENSEELVTQNAAIEKLYNRKISFNIEWPFSYRNSIDESWTEGGTLTVPATAYVSEKDSTVNELKLVIPTLIRQNIVNAQYYKYDGVSFGIDNLSFESANTYKTLSRDIIYNPGVYPEKYVTGPVPGETIVALAGANQITIVPQASLTAVFNSTSNQSFEAVCGYYYEIELY